MLKISKEKDRFDKIVKDIKKNSHDGLEVFYNEYKKLIFLTAKGLGCSKDKAEVVANSVLIKVWRNIDKLDKIDNPLGWIYIVTCNCAKDELKGKRTTELNESIIRVEDNIKEVIDRDSFDYTISCLKEHEKKMMVLKFGKDYSLQEIANINNRPLSTTSSTYYRALEKVKKFYKNKNFE